MMVEARTEVSEIKSSVSAVTQRASVTFSKELQMTPVLMSQHVSKWAAQCYSSSPKAALLRSSRIWFLNLF